MTDTAAPRRRLLLIGWDAADWIIIDQLIEAGRMPHLARLVEAGTMGNLASLSPCLSPMLWSSAATGHTADRHGILGFVEPRPDGLGLLPSQSSSRRCKALWNILGESGLRPCVVAWPVSDPPEPIPGVCLSERLIEGLADRPEAIGPAPAGCVYPASLLPFVSELRLHPCELAPGDLAGLIPEIDRIDLDADRRPEHLARLYARCATVHAVATAAMEAEPWDFFAVYYDAIDKAGHDFMAYRAPRLPGIPEEDQRVYGGVMDGLYAFHDAMLGRLLALAGEDTTVILMSDHGFQSGARRPAAPDLHRDLHGAPPGSVAAEGADWHRHLGVFAIQGPGIKRDERISGATLLDITPTVLTLFGLPVGRDMPGRVLTGAFEVPPEVRQVDTWEDGGPAAAPATIGPAAEDALRRTRPPARRACGSWSHWATWRRTPWTAPPPCAWPAGRRNSISAACICTTTARPRPCRSSRTCADRHRLSPGTRSPGCTPARACPATPRCSPTSNGWRRRDSPIPPWTCWRRRPWRRPGATVRCWIAMPPRPGATPPIPWSTGWRATTTWPGSGWRRPR